MKRRYIELYGVPTKENILTYATRVTSIWYNRDKIQERYKKKREKAAAGNNTVLIPRAIHHKRTPKDRADAFGSDDMPRKIYDMLAQILQFHKDESKVQTEIRDELRRGNDLIAAQNVLFEKLANRKKGNDT